MIRKIPYNETARYRGRNGVGKAVGLCVSTHQPDEVVFRPITQRYHMTSEACVLCVKLDALPALIDLLVAIRDGCPPLDDAFLFPEGHHDADG